MAYVDLRRRRGDRSRRGPEAPRRGVAADPLFLLTSGFALGSLASFFLSALLARFLGYLSPAFSLVLVSLLVLVLYAGWRRPGSDGGKATPKVGSEKQLLMAVQDAGDGVTPVEAALGTSLTVDEAEEMLTRLADRGHLVVGSRDGALLYALPGRRPAPEKI